MTGWKLSRTKRSAKLLRHQVLFLFLFNDNKRTPSSSFGDELLPYFGMHSNSLSKVSHIELKNPEDKNSFIHYLYVKPTIYCTIFFHFEPTMYCIPTIVPRTSYNSYTAYLGIVIKYFMFPEKWNWIQWKNASKVLKL